MADKDFVVKNGLRTVGNTIVANSSQISLNSNVVIDSAASLSANGSVGSAGQYLLSNGSGIYWATVAVGTNVAASFAWTNTHSFSNVVTFNGNTTIANTLTANGGVGTAGQVLTSNGSTGSPYWATPAAVNTASQYTFTNTIVFSNLVTTNGRLQLDNVVTANGSNGTAGQVLASNGNVGSPYWVSVGAGTVTQVNTGSGLTGGPISATGTIAVNPNTGIVANSTGVFVANTYVNTSADFTVSGQMTFSNVATFNANAAFRAISANGSFGTAGHALFSGGGTTNNYFSNVVTAVSVTSGQIAATYSGANPTLGLATTAVTPGCYTSATICVDSYGRITSASSGAGGSGTVTCVCTGTGLTGGPISTTGTLSLATAGPGAATYGATGGGVACVTLDAYGRISSVTCPASAYATQSYVTGQGYLTSAVTSLSGGTGVSVSGSTGSVTVCIAQAVGTTCSVRFGSLGVGTTATGTSGEIVATGNITAYYSDKRLKKCINPIENALCKVTKISGVTYRSNEIAEKYGYQDTEEQVGVIAQEIEEILPQIIKPAPFDTEWTNGVARSISGENYKTVQYEKLVPLLIEAIKELNARVEALEKRG